MSRLQDVILRSTRALQPAATAVAVGTIYYVTDESVTERSNGATWDDISDGGSSGITQLTSEVTAGPGSGSQAATVAATHSGSAHHTQSHDHSLAGDGQTLSPVTLNVPAGAVTYAGIQDISAASKLLGRGSAGGAGDTEEITLGTNLSMSGTTLNAAAGGGGGGTAVKKASDESVVGSTTLQADDELSFAIGATETKQFDIVLFVEGSAGDIKVAIDAPAGATGFWCPHGVLSGTTSGNLAAMNDLAAGSAQSFILYAAGGGGIGACVIISGLINTTGTAGNITLHWAQNTASGTTTIKANSYLIHRTL